MKSPTIEQRLERVEQELAWAKPILTELAKQLEIMRPRINPIKFCRDKLDRQIMNYLVDNVGAGATEIAAGIGSENPDVARHMVGKRIKRMYEASNAVGAFILNFDTATREHPVTHEQKYRAWWLKIEEIDVEAFKKSVEGNLS